MNLICLLSWHDEQPRHLAELIASLTLIHITHLIAIDGPYHLYPHDHHYSPTDQHHAILNTAIDHGITTTIHIPAQPWAGNEIEKRTVLFHLGHAQATAPTDWFYIADGDEVITHAPPDLHHRLTTSIRLAGTTHYYENTVGNQQPIRKLFRSHPEGIRVQGNHAHYIDGDNQQLWKPGNPVDEVPADHHADLKVMHRPAQRTRARLQARDRYYARRNVEHSEVWT